MLKIKITWPLLIALLFALLVWLIKASTPPVAAPTTQPDKPLHRAKVLHNKTSSRQEASARRKPAIILSNDDVPAGDTSEFDNETDRLDREAVEFARASMSETTPFEMRRGAWQS